MPIYDLTCQSCGTVDEYPIDYHSAPSIGRRAVGVECYHCGATEMIRESVELPADMSTQWANRCRFKHGVRGQCRNLSVDEKRSEFQQISDRETKRRFGVAD